MMPKRHIFVLIFTCLFGLPFHAVAQWSVFEDLLYWHASQQPTSIWAYQFSLDTNSPADPGSQGSHFVEPNLYFGWNSGLRVGIEQTPEIQFDKKLYWTHFSTSTRDALTSPEGQFLLPQFFNGFTTTSIYNTANIHWNIEMNMMDANIGHVFHPADTVAIHPAVGIKGGTINQAIQSSWQLNQFGFIFYQSDEQLSNNFFGIGPSLSIDSRLNLLEGFGILSNFETALLWGHWRIKDDFYRPNSIFYAEKTISSQTNDTLGSFMTHYFLGFEWAFHVKAAVKIKAGYELEFWANQLRLPIFQALPIHGDLTLQGATCGIYITL